MIAPKFNALDFNFLMKVDCVNFRHAIFQICLCVEHVICTYVAYFDKVGEKPLVDGLCGMGHIAFAFKVCFF